MGTGETRYSGSFIDARPELIDSLLADPQSFSGHFLRHPLGFALEDVLQPLRVHLPTGEPRDQLTVFDLIGDLVQPTVGLEFFQFGPPMSG